MSKIASMIIIITENIFLAKWGLFLFNERRIIENIDKIMVAEVIIGKSSNRVLEISVTELLIAPREFLKSLDIRMINSVRNINIIAIIQMKIRIVKDINGEKDRISPMIE